MNKKSLFKTFLILLMFSQLFACTNAKSYLKYKNEALQAKKKAYTNDSQVNTSFTLTMGEREFILGEREVENKNYELAAQHFKKAKDFYNEAYISSFIFQRNWTLENYQRILTLKEKHMLISEILYETYRYAAAECLNGNEDSKEIKRKLEKFENAKKEMEKFIKKSDKYLQKALELSNDYDMFQTKYVTLDAIKEIDKAIDILKDAVSEFFPNILSRIDFGKRM